MGFGFDPETSDVNNKGGLTGALTVGTSAVEVKIGANRLAERETVRIYNSSTSRVFFSFDSGLTGAADAEPIEKKQWVEIPAGPDVPVYLIRASGSEDIIIHEMA